jgi:hypothetical protein
MSELQDGTPVQVRPRFEATWAEGFTVAGRDGDGYRLRRDSDGTTLPCSFAHEAVRPAQGAAPGGSDLPVFGSDRRRSISP